MEEEREWREGKEGVNGKEDGERLEGIWNCCRKVKEGEHAVEAGNWKGED